MRTVTIALALCLVVGCKTSVEADQPPARPSALPRAAEGAAAAAPTLQPAQRASP